MGEIYRAQCPKCSYEGTFHLGGGLMSPKPAHCLRVLPEEERPRLQALLDEGETTCLAESMLFKGCCGDEPLTARSVVTARDKSGAEHVFGNRCQSCGGALVPVEGREIPCPVCGEPIPLKITGLWD